MIPLDRGKGVPSFDEMMDIALVEVDFDDPTTDVRGHHALAIAKPTPRGYCTRRSTINLTTRVYFLQANKEQEETKIAIWILRIKEESFIDQVGFYDVLVWSLNTNEVREVAAMVNF